MACGGGAATTDGGDTREGPRPDAPSADELPNLGELDGSGSDVPAAGAAPDTAGDATTDLAEVGDGSVDVADGPLSEVGLDADAGKYGAFQFPGWSCANGVNPSAHCAGPHLLDLGAPSGYSAEPLDINDRGDVLLGGFNSYSGLSLAAGRCMVSIPLSATLLDDRRTQVGGAIYFVSALNASSTVAATLDASDGFTAMMCNGSCIGFRESVPDANGLMYAQAFANAINDRDELVGRQSFSFGPSLTKRYDHAFQWSLVAEEDLTAPFQTPPGPSPALIGPDVAMAVNDAGQVVGSSNSRAVMWSDGKKTDLTTAAMVPSSAIGINAAGQIIGATGSGGALRAFMWSAGNLTDLGTLGGQSAYPTAINASGQVAGSSQTKDGHLHAFLWSAGNMTDLGTLGGSASLTSGPTATLALDYQWQGVVTSFPYTPNARRALNDAGRVVGTSTTSTGEIHAFLWSGGAMKDLGTLGGTSRAGVTSEGVAIDSAGAAVGIGFVPGETQAHAFLYDLTACP